MFRYVSIDDTDQWADNIQKLGKVYMRFVYDDTQTYDGERRLYFVGYYLTFDGDADQETMDSINESEENEEECTWMDSVEADDLPYDKIDAEDIDEAREYCRGHMFLPLSILKSSGRDEALLNNSRADKLPPPPETIIFTAEEDAAEKEVLKTALEEFVSIRTPIDRYVQDRYEGQTPKFIQNKIAEVAKQLAVAREMMKRK